LKYGTPLFQKLDNGGNLDAQSMREVLSAHCVIPLNSPPYYPRYNGTMEHAQNELQREVERIVAAEGISTEEGFVVALHRATNSLTRESPSFTERPPASIARGRFRLNIPNNKERRRNVGSKPLRWTSRRIRLAMTSIYGSVKHGASLLKHGSSSSVS